MTEAIIKTDIRWGDTHIDRRNWTIYNEQLVKRGEYFLDIDFVKNWQNELKVMNQNKRGAPFLFPNSLIELQAIWHAKNVNYRLIEGITRDLCKFGQIPEFNDYSTINRRVNELSCNLILPKSNKLIGFADGTGFHIADSGEYMQEKYGKKNRRWIQVVIIGDPDSKEPISYEVNLVQESELDSCKRQLKDLLYDGINFYGFGGDGSYDAIKLWNWLDYNNIEPIIKPDKNAVYPSGSRIRDLNVKERNAVGYNLWATEHEYGNRWPATEGIFSAVKRIFGEQIHAKTEKGMKQEAKIKFWAYQKMKRYGEAKA